MPSCPNRFRCAIRIAKGLASRRPYSCLWRSETTSGHGDSQLIAPARKRRALRVGTQIARVLLMKLPVFFIPAIFLASIHAADSGISYFHSLYSVAIGHITIAAVTTDAE